MSRRRRIEDHLRRLSAYIRRVRVWYSRVRDAPQGSSSHLTFADGPICENERGSAILWEKDSERER